MPLDNVEDIYPLSPTQQGMVFHTLYDQGSGTYFQQVVYTLTGSLHADAFKRAWQAALDRHSALRTAFLWQDLDAPLQVVRQQVQLPWSQHDWRATPPAQQREQLDALLAEHRARGFDLAESPLLNCTLLQIGDDRWWFVWNHHHVILDAWSISLVLGDVFALYDAFRRDVPARLEAARPYRDYIAWLQQQDAAAATVFWRQTLQGFTAPTPLPGDKAPGQRAAQAPQWVSQTLRLSQALTTALTALGQQHKLTLNTVVQGAWALMLSRYSGLDDVLFGVTTAGRPAVLPGVESIVGLFINTMVARIQVAQDRELIPWLHSLQAQHIQHERYAYSPLVDVQGWSDVPRGTPLFESFLVFENASTDEANVAQVQRSGLTIEGIQYTGQTNYPLRVAAVPGAELLFDLRYDANRFDSEAIGRMLQHLHTLLQTISDHPHRRLRELPWLTADEYQQIVIDWNPVAGDDQPARCLHQLFEEQAARTPERVAVVAGQQTLSYAALDRRANQLAHLLRQQGVGPDRLVGLCVERSLDQIVGVLGILKAGGAYVPLDPGYPQSRLALMLRDARLAAIVTQSTLVEQLPEHPTVPVCVDTLNWDALPERAARPVDPGALAYVIYTSGSTGQPKGVAIEHRQLCSYLHAILTRLDIPDGAQFATVSTFAADLGNTMIFPSLCTGGTLHIIDQDRAADPNGLAAYFRQQPVDYLKIVPSHLAALLSAAQPADLLPRRCLVLGGEAARWSLVETVRGLQPSLRILNHYGPTETTVGVLTYPLWQAAPTTAATVPLGRPLPHVRAYVLDQRMQPVPVGVVGELYLGGAQLARGYYQRPAQTAERFVPDPFGQRHDEARFGARLYRTGDLVRYHSSGVIEYLGRADDQVKIRGYRIELGEIEATLLRHPGIQAATVVVGDDPGGQQRLVAYVVGAEAAERLDSAALRSFAHEQLPAHMVPSAFVVLESLPLTANGKIDRRALPTPDQQRQDGEATFVAPRTFVEEELAAIWRDLLHIDQVGVHDNFFVLGGHSLLLMQLASRIHETFEVDIPLRLLFDTLTVVDMSMLIAQQLIAQEDPQELDEMFQELHQLSPDELRVLLETEE